MTVTPPMSSQEAFRAYCRWLRDEHKMMARDQWVELSDGSHDPDDNWWDLMTPRHRALARRLEYRLRVFSRV